MPASARHPLDADLLDLVEGTLPPTAADDVEAHLAGCVVCRIKRHRLMGEPPTEPTHLGDTDVPRFRPLDSVDASPDTAVPGELWLTGGDEAVLVLIRQILDRSQGLVVPAAFDVEAADSGTLVFDADASPLGVPLAIFDGMPVRLPLDVLRSRVIPERAVDLLAVGVGTPGVRLGSPLEGPVDPRHEVREHIADRLRDLASAEGEATPPDGILSTDGFDEVRHQLEDLRSSNSTVEPFATPAGCPDGWLGLGRVIERHLSILVIGTPAGLTTESDYVAARGVAVRWHASALVICSAGGGTVDLYTPKGLYDAMQVPLGHRSPEPTVSGLDLIDSVGKFFDLHPLWHVPAASQGRPVTSINVSELLERNGRVAAANLAKKAVRGAGKREAYTWASTRGDELAAILQQALASTLDPQDIQALADRQPE
ncbi:MAG: zf-HC2 domain-containing protein [Acidimicrobiales bacterium]